MVDKQNALEPHNSLIVLPGIHEKFALAEEDADFFLFSKELWRVVWGRHLGRALWASGLLYRFPIGQLNFDDNILSRSICGVVLKRLLSEFFRFLVIAC